MVIMNMQRHLILKFEGPILAFGAPIIDQLGKIQDFPATSTLTGLLGNALGYDRSEFDLLQKLQDNIIFGIRLDRLPQARFIDYQTVKLHDVVGWTTRGYIEKREGESRGPTGKTHLRYRSFDADGVISVALRLKSSSDDLSLDQIAQAITYPRRPLFLGRKPCLPSTYIFQGFIEANNILEALSSIQTDEKEKSFLMFWPPKEGSFSNCTHFSSHDLRNWKTGVHAGESLWARGKILLKGEVL